MDEDKILIRLFSVVAKKLRHKRYKHTVDKHKEYMALVAGVGLDDMLKQYVRREDEILFKQRVRLTQHIVTAVAENLLDPFAKVPRSNSGRRLLTYENDKEEKLKDLEKILFNFWGDEQSWDDYMATRFLELNSIDPNSFVCFEFGDFDNNRELIKPYPYEVSSTMAVDYKKVNNVLEYLIAKDSHTYKVKKDLATNALLNSVLPNDADYKKGEKFTLYTKNATFQLKQVHEKEENGLENIVEGKPTKLGEEGREFVKLGGAYYTLHRFTPHNLGVVPLIEIGYKRDLATHGETFVAPYHAAIPFLMKTIKTNSELDLVATLLAFPQQIRRGQPCPDDSCLNGTYDDGSTCNTCGGHGTVVTAAPTAQDAIIVPTAESKEQLIPLSEYIDYNNPPVDIVEWQDSYIDKLTIRAKKFMYSDGIYSKSRTVKTATEVDIDMDNVYDKLYPYAIKFGKSWRAGVIIMAKLADREKGLIANYTFGKDFKQKTLNTLIGDLVVAKDTGSPSLVKHLRDDIALIIFGENPLELQRYQLKELHNPFSGKTEKEITLLMSGNLVSLKQKVLHANYKVIFDELEIEYAKANNGGDFYQLGRLKQRELIYAKVDKLIAEIAEENPDPVLDLGE